MRQLTLLTLSIVLVSCVVAPVALALQGTPAVVTALLAAVVCFAPSAITLILADRFTGPLKALFALCIGMALRLFAALAACLVVYRHDSPFADAGFVYYLLFFYMVTLAVETALLVRSTGSVLAANGDAARHA